MPPRLTPSAAARQFEHLPISSQDHVFLPASQIRSLIEGGSRHSGNRAVQRIADGYSVPVESGPARLVYSHERFSVGIRSLCFRILGVGQVALAQNDVIES